MKAKDFLQKKAIRECLELRSVLDDAYDEVEKIGELSLMDAFCVVDSLRDSVVKAAKMIALYDKKIFELCGKADEAGDLAGAVYEWKDE